MSSRLPHSVSAVVYAAKSTMDPRGSIPDQLRRVREAAEAQGRQVVAEFSDENASAFKGNRGQGLVDARSLAERLAGEEGEAELWILRSDRLARGGGAGPGDALHLVEYVLWARRANVKLRSVEDDFAFTHLVMAVTQGERAFEDSRVKGLAVASGMRRRAEAGKWHGRAPYGYAFVPDVVDPTSGRLLHRLEPDDRESPVVSRIFREFTSGLSESAITKRLIADGVPARERKWHQGTVSKILRRSAYLGVVEFNGKVYPGNHPPLVDAEVWEHARILREQATYTMGGNRGRRADWALLAGLLTSPCGGRMGSSPVAWCRSRRWSVSAIGGS
jgi:site-specific DNA recombinase